MSRNVVVVVQYLRHFVTDVYQRGILQMGYTLNGPLEYKSRLGNPGCSCISPFGMFTAFRSLDSCFDIGEGIVL